METPTQPAQLTHEQKQQAQYRQLLHYTSLGALFVCPLIIALPPRKFDLYTIGLFVATGVGANQVAREYTGRSIGDRFAAVTSKFSAQHLPSDKAREVQEKLKEERRIRGLGTKGLEAQYLVGPGRGGATTQEVVRELERRKGGEGGKSVLDKIWYGGEGEDWKEKRLERERKALEEGKGYGDLIMEQIWDVISWGKGSAEEVKEKSEEVVEETKKESSEKK
jgi:hypothetical protein